MLRFLDQVLSGTRLDSQGERLSRPQLERYCHDLKGQKFPLHQHHDMALEPLGIIENLRVEPDPNMPGEWSLIGDVTVERGSLDEALKGFSISFTESIREAEDADLLIYIPYPFYNDRALIEILLSDPKITVGKWIKKNLDPGTLALFGSGVLFALGPAWEDFYKRKVAPCIERFLETYGSILSDKGLGLECVQYIEFKGNRIELRFIPPRDQGIAYLAPKILQQGIALVHEVLRKETADPSSGRIIRVVFSYDVAGHEYYISRTERAHD
jgi:hypothetical protein